MFIKKSERETHIFIKREKEKQRHMFLRETHMFIKREKGIQRHTCS